MAKRISALLIMLVLALSMAMAAFALEVPNTEREDCSITITMHKGETLVPGGKVQLFRVGAISEDGGTYSFVPTGFFEDCGLSFEVLDAKLAKDLAEIAKGEEPITEVSVGKDAKVTFEKLQTGLYLVVQNKAASGYQKAEPFLVSVPYYDEITGKYDYSVDAYPKVDIQKETGPTEPTKPKPPKLPQTGQTNWPVPVLLVGGIGLMLLGILLRGGRKTDEYET